MCSSDLTGPVAVLQSLVPLTGFLVAVLLVVSTITRRWSLTAATGALLGVCIAISVPSLLGNTVAPDGDDLVVIGANLGYGGADAQSLVSAAREHRADVLVLVEVTPSSLARLRAAGLDTLLPRSAGKSTQGPGGTIIRSRVPMTLVQSGLDRVSPYAFDEPVVSLHRSTGDVVLRAVHSLPPGRGAPRSARALARSCLGLAAHWRQTRRFRPRMCLLVGGSRV